MKREEATSLLRDIIETCDGIGEKGVMLMPPNADDVLSHGYQLHIKGAVKEYLSCIEPIITKRGLAVAHEPSKNLVVIYRPINKEIEKTA